MPYRQAIAEAKKRIERAEKAVLGLENELNPDQGLRTKLTHQLRQALDDYYAVVCGEARLPCDDVN